LRRHSLDRPQDSEQQLSWVRSGEFPGDRLYTTGHWWVQVLSDGDEVLLKCGLDVFAAAIIGRCSKVIWKHTSDVVGIADPICQIDFGLGLLSVGAPVSGAIVSQNSLLHDKPGQLIASPYERGWIVELMTTDRSRLDSFLAAEAARQESLFDLHRFRRRVAMQTLAEDVQGVGRTAADGGELVTDLRQMLGGSAYQEMLRELVH
jgi:glycine cleavage system H protein